MAREALLARTFVQLADTLVGDFDVVDLLTLVADGCVEILDVSVAGLMLVTARGSLRCVAWSSDARRVLDVFEDQSTEGPGPDCYRSGRPVVNVDLAGIGGPRHRFVYQALAAGFRTAHAVPMHLRDRPIGALSWFRTGEDGTDAADVVVAQALADMATISVAAQRSGGDIVALNEQAINRRVVIEQANGMVAESLAISMAHAISRLSDHARAGNLKLGDVALSIIDRTFPPRSLQPLRDGR
jgi:GAF domain-containing protein